MTDRQVSAQVRRNVERWLARASALSEGEYAGAARAVRFGLGTPASRLAALRLARECLAGGYGRRLAAALCDALEPFFKSSRRWKVEAKAEYQLALARASVESGKLPVGDLRWLEEKAAGAGRKDWQAELGLIGALLHMAEGDLEGADRLAAEVKFQVSNDPRIQDARLDALMLLGRRAALAGKYGRALELYREGEATAGALERHRKRAQCSNNAALCLFEYGDVLSALNEIGRAIQMFRQMGDEEGAVGGEFLRAVFHFRSGRSGPAEQALARLFISSPAAADPERFGTGWMELARSLRMLLDDADRRRSG